ncbi:hypothetical protein ACFX14_012946 [Malus domestica]
MDMVSASASSSARKRKTTSFHSKKMTLEDYLLLIQSNFHLHLTVAHLNQIISMHGYKKIYKVPKAHLSDTVGSLPLVDPARLKLRDYISPFMITTLEDVVTDLADLNWKKPYGFISAPNSTSKTARPEKKLVPKRKRKRSPVAAGFARAALDSVLYGSY